MMLFMKRLIVVFLSVLLAAGAAFALDLDSFTKRFDDKSSWQSSLDELEKMLDQASSNEEKAEIYWRMSLFACYLGSSQEKTADMRAWYEKGIKYAELGMECDPSNRNCLLWHCACIGRDVQTKGLSSQLSGVDTMLKDLNKIINELGNTDFSEAWHALGEIYWRHPFKSTSSAVSFFRAAIDNIPKGEVRVVTYRCLAESLYSRNWSAKKRVSEFASMQKKWNADKFKDTIEKYSVYEGRNGSDVRPVWTTVTLGSMSDRQEAKVILSYVKLLYEKSGVTGYAEEKDYKEVLDLLAKW